MARAFTLIELMVVIGIVALLAALIFPAFISAKKAAKSTGCLSNLHQIGVAITLYSNDSDDLFPNAVDNSDKTHPEQWNPFPAFESQIPDMPLMQDALQPYVKNREVFHCPADNGSEVLDDHFPLAYQGSPSDFATFGSSYLYRTEITFRRLMDTSLQMPSAVNMYFDAAGHWHGSTGEATPDDDMQSFFDKLSGYRYNTLFADMHAKSLSNSQLQSAWATPL